MVWSVCDTCRSLGLRVLLPFTFGHAMSESSPAAVRMLPLDQSLNIRAPAA